MNTSHTPELRPLAIGELIDRSTQVWRSNFGTLFRLYLVFQLASYILTKLWELVTRLYFPAARGGAAALDKMQHEPLRAFVDYVGSFGLLFLVLVATMWLSWIVGVAGASFAIRRELGEQVTLRDAFERVKQRLGTVTGAFILSSLWGVGVGLLSVIPGFVLIVALAIVSLDNTGGMVITALFGTGVVVLGMIGAMLWWVLRFLLTAQVIAMEDVGAVEALRRSGALISGRVGQGFLNRVKVRATLLLTIIFVILMAAGLIAGLPATILQFVYANPLDPMNANPDAIPQALLIPAQLLQVLATAVFSPLYLVVGALFYLDMRVRREGLDLELQLARGSQSE